MRRVLHALSKAATVYYWTISWLFWVTILAIVDLGIAAEMVALSVSPIHSLRAGLYLTGSASVLFGIAGLALGIKKCIEMIRTWVILLVSVYVLLSAIIQLRQDH